MRLRSFLQSDALRHDREIEHLKEVLEELVRRIQHAQSKEKLQEKVKLTLNCSWLYSLILSNEYDQLSDHFMPIELSVSLT